MCVPLQRACCPAGQNEALLSGGDCPFIPLPFAQVDEEELRKQREEVTAIVKMRVAGTASGTQVKDRALGGDS